MSRTSDVWLPGSRSEFAGPLLLDTHVWLWYLDGVTERMSADGVELLRRAAGGAGLLVSDISVWEVGNKAAKGKLTLMPSVSAWVGRAAQVPSLSFVPLARDTLLFSTQLPGMVHGDPADRMLIASAALESIPLITADRLILAYAEESRLFSACDVRS
jgi:PIN domain nuclease of toxin-antitoxin system